MVIQKYKLFHPQPLLKMFETISRKLVEEKTLGRENKSAKSAVQRRSCERPVICRSWKITASVE